MAHLSVSEAAALITAALEASRTSPENAASVARALVDAELTGQGGHGLSRVPAYAAQARAGKVDGFAMPKATRTRPGALHVDAGFGFSYPALELAAEHLPAMARGQGIAIASIFHSHHAGSVGQMVEALANDGLVALMFANAPAAIAPWGGRRALFGTNPIAFACPVAAGAPVVVDLSLSKVARGKLLAAEQKGETIPEGWAFDPSGDPTTDPARGMAGTMAPMGDAKGTALALMVELLAAGLGGANYAYEASSFFDDKGDPPNTGQAIIAIDPEAFGGVAVLERFARIGDAVSECEGARLPGRRRQALRESRRGEGFEAPDALIAQIRSIARE